jgi:hypothetical protein
MESLTRGYARGESEGALGSGERAWALAKLVDTIGLTPRFLEGDAGPAEVFGTVLDVDSVGKMPSVQVRSLLWAGRLDQVSVAALYVTSSRGVGVHAFEACCR